MMHVTDSSRRTSLVQLTGEGITLFLVAGILALSGCNGSSDSAPDEGNTAAQAPAVPPLASIESSATQPDGERTAELPKSIESSEDDWALDDPESDAADDEPLVMKEPDPGTPEWLVREIALTRAKSAQKDDPAYRQQQEEIIKLALQAVVKTHSDKEREQIFNNAVHYLADARMQLALLGDSTQVQCLIDDAEQLYRRDAKSFAAMESALKLVQLAEQKAAQQGEEEQKWAKEFSRQARLFAERFPQETHRVALNLISASRACDRARLQQEALTCLSIIKEKFADTPFAEQTAPMMRRLQLPGNPLTDFGGSTHDGGHLTIDQYQGRVVLIAFWASNSARFRSDLKEIRRVLETYPTAIRAIGVNLDRDETAVDRFLEETGIGWKHIFYSDPEKRGAHNLVARHYGVTNVPTYWLVDRNGIVREIDLQPEQLEEALGKMSGR